MESTIVDRLQADLKSAMREGDATARDTIRFTLSALKNAAIDKGSPLSDEDALSVLQREAKRRADSIAQFESAGRADLVERETNQLAVLQRYLPAALSDTELQQLVATVISETGASSPKDLGRVMPILIDRAKGAADGRRLSEEARRQLAST